MIFRILQYSSFYLLCILVLSCCDTDDIPVSIAKNDTVPNLDTLSHTPVFKNVNWERHGTILNGFFNAYQPCVIQVPDTVYPFRMWFFGWINGVCNPEIPGCDAIYHARSKNLDTWEVYCNDMQWRIADVNNPNTSQWQSVLYPSANAPFWDAWHNGDPSVVFKDGTYYMAYSATSNDFGGNHIAGYPSDMICCVMGATSLDGINWTKTAKPLLISSFDTKFPPDANAARIGDFHRPCLLWDKQNSKWMLYFDYYIPALADKGISQWGLAENSGDFMTGSFNIKNSLETPLLYSFGKEFPNSDVRKIGPGYIAVGDPGWYGAFGWASRQICGVSSSDGFSDWKPVFVIPPDEDVVANQVPQLLVCRMGGKWWLYIFYATQIGMRTPSNNWNYEANGFSPGSYNWCYDQIRYMRQEIK
ncbi:MAG: hypothetical protein U0W24_02060 [Bacteroidales bacterium]